MRNLSDLTGSELSKCLCALVVPAEKVFSDCAVTQALDAYRSAIEEKTSFDRGFSLFVTMLFPVLMKHEDEVYAILGAMNDVSGEEIKQRNGVEMMRDMLKAFVLDGELAGIFRPGCEIRGE